MDKTNKTDNCENSRDKPTERMKLGRSAIITISYKQNQVTSIFQDLRDQKTSATSVDVLLSDGDQDHYIIITKSLNSTSNKVM